MSIATGINIGNIRNQGNTALNTYSIDENDYVLPCTIVDWNLEAATSINSFLGSTGCFKNNITGVLPMLDAPNCTSAQDAFGYMFGIDEFSGIRLSACTSAYRMCYCMTGLSELPEIVEMNSTASLSYMFYGCINASKESIETDFWKLAEGNPSNTSSCFTRCGMQNTGNSLENIPKKWGGSATYIGTNFNGSITPLAVGGKILKL